MLTQNDRTQWFMAQTLRHVFAHGIVRVGYSPFLTIL